MRLQTSSLTRPGLRKYYFFGTRDLSGTVGRKFADFLFRKNGLMCIQLNKVMKLIWKFLLFSREIK